ncbi:cell division protein FtsQ/DivIB [Streptococcus infantis]|uniref:cell division protein FtsQ/DivIB n=1 Tax=Streptococcus infantis TaxID=68892 RepID=UPI0020C844F9|nr:cell division protein FtsQ/DivIB [Streptococcus infantis]MCP9056356.1 cell division protein FtsQ/DivIB [Streptococcus infantis]MCP9080446.1 cell division protein FtsQ/DivIB [Streptococcus infantis]
MSKDKKNQDTQGKELSEWQKRNQEYLQKKAEEEAKRAAEEAREKEEQAAKSASENTQELSEWQKQNQEYLSKKTEEESVSSDEVDQESEKSEEKDSDTSDETSNEEKDSEKISQEDAKSQDQVEKEKVDEKVKKQKKVKTKSKPPKPAIPSIHIWRAVTILVPSFLILFLSIYLLTPLSTLKHIEVTGTVQTTADQVKEASGIQDSDYTISLLLNKDKHAEMVKSDRWIESAKIVYQFPVHFTIEVKEFEIVAYSVSGDNYYPILSSGSIESTAVNAANLPEKYISVLFNDEEQIKTLISQLNEVSPEIKQEIEKIELAPSKVTSDLLKITMHDTDEILVPLSELGKKLPYYSKIKPQLTVPSGIDMEVGIYSYSLVDKALDDERVKAKEEEKKKQEEEKKKQAEQGNQDQTTQTTQTTQSR